MAQEKKQFVMPSGDGVLVVGCRGKFDINADCKKELYVGVD